MIVIYILFGGLALTMLVWAINDLLEIRKANRAENDHLEADLNGMDSVSATERLSIETLRHKKPYIDDRRALAHIFDMIEVLSPDGRDFLTTELHNCFNLLDPHIPEEEIIIKVLSGPYFRR